MWCTVLLTRLSQFQGLLGFDDIVSVLLETCELALEDGQQIGSIIWAQVSLEMGKEGSTCIISTQTWEVERVGEVRGEGERRGEWGDKSKQRRKEHLDKYERNTHLYWFLLLPQLQKLSRLLFHGPVLRHDLHLQRPDLGLHGRFFPLHDLVKGTPLPLHIVNIHPATGELESLPVQNLLASSEHLDLLLPGTQLPLQFLHESDEPNSLGGGGSINHVVLQVRPIL